MRCKAGEQAGGNQGRQEKWCLISEEHSPRPRGLQTESVERRALGPKDGGAAALLRTVMPVFPLEFLRWKCSLYPPPNTFSKEGDEGAKGGPGVQVLVAQHKASLQQLAARRLHKRWALKGLYGNTGVESGLLLATESGDLSQFFLDFQRTREPTIDFALY